MLAIEPLNRFECYFLNTMADARAYVQRVGHPNFGALYDTFHANIEEKDPVGVIAQTIDVIRHVHVSENDRGTPGRGHVPWARDLRGAARRRLRRLADDRGVRHGAAGARRGDQGLARLLPEPRGGLRGRPQDDPRRLGGRV